MTELAALPRLDRLHDAFPHARVLSNGRFTSLVTGSGAGFSTWDGLALTGWSGDRTCDDEGTFLYVRDLDDGRVWSLGAAPIASPADAYAVTSGPGTLRIEREDGDLESVCEVAIAPAQDVELRWLRLANRGETPRRLALTTYLEVVIHHPGGHAAHPVFSRLFVSTEWDAAAEVLLARRRPHFPGAREPWLAHAWIGPGTCEIETDRRRFLGRGRDRTMPCAIATEDALSGSVGSVLDPIFAIRRVVEIPPGESVELVSLVAAADSRDRAIAQLAPFRDSASWSRTFDAAAAQERERLAALERSARDADFLHELTTALLYGRIATKRPADPATSAAPAPVTAVEARRYWNALGLPMPVSDELVDAVAAELATERATASYPAGARLELERRSSPASAVPATALSEPLAYDNGYGGFTDSGDEYVIRVVPDGPHATRPPLPWINAISNERFGCLVSETGAGYTWSRNSREHRLTPWSNDPVSDPHGEAIYVRDPATGRMWSPCPGPVPSPEPCEVRHGFGYTRFRRDVEGLDHRLTVFVAHDEPVKVAWLEIRNPTATARALTVWSYARVVLGVLPSDTVRSVVTQVDEAMGAIVARNPASPDFADGYTFATVLTDSAVGAVTCTADRTAFLGRNGSVRAPAAVIRGEQPLDGRCGAGLDPCAAFQVPIRIAAGGTATMAFLLGETTDLEEARAWVLRFREPGAVAAAFGAARDAWHHTVSALRVLTPSPAIDRMLSGWLAYQTLSCRLWGRSAFYQSGGAFGFRDQLQDSLGLLYHRPELTRAQIVLHAGHQFLEGDVLHWWHPPQDRGTRTRFSDDLVWLPYVTALYVRATGDSTVLDEQAPFLRARLLHPGEDETYLAPEASGESAPVYEHCCRVLDRSLTRGAHGLPLMGTGDWNDGMNRVGREGRGESVWLAFFLVHVIDSFAPLAEARGDHERAARYRAYASSLQDAIEATSWDGAWYRRAYYDDGTPLGSAADDECRIDALAQAWAVISGVAPEARAAAALDAVERELVLDDPGMIRLLTPPFDKTKREPGYIKGYLPGIRENGGQYTHAALWVVRALAELGRRDRAVELFTKLTPIHHGRDRAAVDVYQVEPYVVVADIYGVEPHVGRGGWSWYTGSSGWMQRVGLESILGLTIENGNTLVLAPRIPDAWPGYTIEWRAFDGRTTYRVEVVNPGGNAAGIVEVSVDGTPAAIVAGAARVPIASDGAEHRVCVTLGARS